MIYSNFFLQSQHAGWNRRSCGVDVRALVHSPVRFEWPRFSVRFERDRILCRHGDRAVVVFAAILLHKEGEQRSTVPVVVGAHDEVACASSRAHQEDGGELFSQRCFLGAFERGEVEVRVSVASDVGDRRRSKGDAVDVAPPLELYVNALARRAEVSRSCR